MVQFLSHGSNAVSVSVRWYRENSPSVYHRVQFWGRYSLHCILWTLEALSRLTVCYTTATPTTINYAHHVFHRTDILTSKIISCIGDGVELIKTKPVAVKIVVVHHGLPFTSCQEQRIASDWRQCHSSLIRQKRERVLQWINGYVDSCQSAGELVVLSTLKGPSNSTFDSDIYNHSTDHQLCDFQNRLLQQSSCRPLSLSDGAYSVYSETLNYAVACSQNYLWQEEVTTTWRHFWGTNFTGCMFLREWSKNGIQSTAHTGADIDSIILHQRHGCSAVLYTLLGDTQPSHLAKIKDQKRRTGIVPFWLLVLHSMELTAGRY